MPQHFVNDGYCIIVSAPSGAGKTSIVHALLNSDLPLKFSISATSRARRGDEVDGRDYFFMTVKAFEQKIKEGAFLEWEEVYPGQYYGTLREEVEKIWASGHHVIFDVDVIGGLNLKKAFGKRALSIYIKAPDINALEERLRKRRTESDEKIKMRVDKAHSEMIYAKEFDVRIMNDQLKRACDETRLKISTFLADQNANQH